MSNSPTEEDLNKLFPEYLIDQSFTWTTDKIFSTSLQNYSDVDDHSKLQIPVFARGFYFHNTKPDPRSIDIDISLRIQVICLNEGASTFNAWFQASYLYIDLNKQTVRKEVIPIFDKFGVEKIPPNEVKVISPATCKNFILPDEPGIFIIELKEFRCGIQPSVCNGFLYILPDAPPEAPDDRCYVEFRQSV